MEKIRFERAAAVYVINDENKVLMLFHKKLETWLPPGGHIEDDELISEGARREVMEEAGIPIEFVNLNNLPESLDKRTKTLPQPFMVQLEDLGDHYHEDFVFLARALNNEIITTEEHEIGWFDIEEMYGKNIFDNTRIQLQKIKNWTLTGKLTF